MGSRWLCLLVLPSLVSGFYAPGVALRGINSKLPRCALHGQQGRTVPLRRAKHATLLALTAVASLDPDVFVKQSEVLAALSMVEDPSRGGSITALGAVKELKIEKDSGAVSFNIELGAPDLKGQVKEKSKELVSTLPWVTSVTVTMVAKEPDDDTRAASASSATGLSGVRNVVLCASCKGGVGKSTTSVNLAYSLHAQGHKVGILDVDIYGPSLPTMVTPTRPFNPAEDIVGNAISPVDGDGVKLMSMGYINPFDNFVLRGAKVSPLVQQLITTTQWGDLDYLIIDMPPGTGDIHLTLAQMDGLRIDAAVIVTTPQRLSFVDVVKGVEMFDKVGIPSVAVVENMAYLEANSATESEHSNSDEMAAFAAKYSLPAEGVEELRQLMGAKQFVFGQGHRQRLLDMWGIINSFSVPIDPTVARQGDSGVPFVKAFPRSSAAAIYAKLAEAVVSEVRKLKEKADNTPKLIYDPSAKEFVINSQQRISAVDLRRMCRSPANNPNAIPATLAPVDWVPLGRYAVSIQWNDGHQSLMPYRAFVDGYES